MAESTGAAVNNTLAAGDPAIAALIGKELERQETHLELIASENFASRAVMEAQGSVLTNKYAEGLPSKDRKSTRLNSSHSQQSRMPSSA